MGSPVGRFPPGPVIGLNYTIFGDPHCPAILFLHGFMGSGADWADAISALEERFYCVAPDLPGHGRSLGLPPEHYTIEGTKEALLGLLDDFGIERPMVVGYSMGGRLALYLALRHPERCSRLFLESASPGIEDATERKARRRSDEEKVLRLESGDLASFLDDWYRQPLFASLTRREGLLQKTIGARLHNDPAELARSLRGMGTENQAPLWGGLGALRAPALAVAGELDEKYVGIASRMEALSPRVRIAVVPEAGHNVRLEAPKAYLALLKRFLGTPEAGF
jgi:2-succinyl-6-hydroxy-2,4-cyclohexadiene-1-carboxylate synthase